MQCRNCSGNEFKTTKSGNFKCSYCGTLYYEETKKNYSGFFKSRKLILISSTAVLILIAMVFTITSDKTPVTDNKTPLNNYTYTNQEKLPEPQGEVLSVDAIPDIIGNVYFLVMCRNSGEIAIRKPEVTIRLLSDKNEKIASGKGYAFIDNLNPGEITPVYILVTNCPSYAKYETDFTPDLPFIIPEGGIFSKKFSAEFIDVTMKQTDAYNNHKIRGRIKNISGHDAKYVQIAAILYNKDDRAVGYGSTYISEKILKPEGFDFFEIYLTTVTEKPEYYKLFFDGSVN
jgi:hypothetical protein